MNGQENLGRWARIGCSVAILTFGGCRAEDGASGLAGEEQGVFVEHGPLAIGSTSDSTDATQVASLIMAPFEGGERVVIGLAGADGFSAERVGRVSAEFLRPLRVLRVWLPPAIRNAAIKDNSFPGFHAYGAYVVRSLRDHTTLFVDVHLNREAVARVTLRSSPAAIVVELKPGGTSFPHREFSTRARYAVLLDPQQGQASYPLEVTGYARTFEATVVAQLKQDGRVVADTFTTAADGIEAWGEFRMRFAHGPRGRVRLHVPEDNPADGARERDLTVDLEME